MNIFLKKKGWQAQVGIEIYFFNEVMQHALEMFNFFPLGESCEVWLIFSCGCFQFVPTKFPSSSQCVPITSLFSTCSQIFSQ